MTTKMPTVEEIRAIASRLCTLSARVYNGDTDVRDRATDMLLAIADHLSNSEPVAWISHHVTADMNFYGAAPLQSSKPGTYAYTPLYTIPPADAEDARRYRYIKSQMEIGAVQTQLPLHRSVYWIGTYIDCDSIQNVDEAIDAEMKGEGHG